MSDPSVWSTITTLLRVWLCARGWRPCATRVRRQVSYPFPDPTIGLYLHPCGRSTWETMRNGERVGDELCWMDGS